MMPGDERRSELTIDGSAVGEVDLAASHLTLLYALLEESFAARIPDPVNVRFPRLADIRQSYQQ